MLGDSLALALGNQEATLTLSNLDGLGVVRRPIEQSQLSVAYNAAGGTRVQGPYWGPYHRWQVDAWVSESEFDGLQALFARHQELVVANGGTQPWVLLSDLRLAFAEPGPTATRLNASQIIDGGDGTISYYHQALVVLQWPRDWFTPAGGSYRVRFSAEQVAAVRPGDSIYGGLYPPAPTATWPSLIILTPSNAALYNVQIGTGPNGGLQYENLGARSGQSFATERLTNLYTATASSGQGPSCPVRDGGGNLIYSFRGQFPTLTQFSLALTSTTDCSGLTGLPDLPVGTLTITPPLPAAPSTIDTTIDYRLEYAN